MALGLKILYLSYSPSFRIVVVYLNDQLEEINKLRLAYSNHRKGNRLECIQVPLFNDTGCILRTKLEALKVGEGLTASNSLLSPRSTGPLRLPSSSTIRRFSRS